LAEANRESTDGMGATPPWPRTHRNLVIVRAGDTSLHETWLPSGQACNWDLVAICFGQARHRYRAPGYTRMDAAGAYAQGPKWPNLQEFVQQWSGAIGQYDFVWFPDDDLAATAATIDRMFALCTHLQLELAQPALSVDSYISHPVTLVNRSFLLRYTNFVEIMAPVFSRDFLRRCVDTFNENLSGYGLDYLWPTRASAPGKLAILDACPVRHTRPVGGPTYRLLNAAGKSAHRELAELLSKYGLTQAAPTIYGGIDGSGRQWRLQNGHEVELVQCG